jgi:hypothetical protein
MVPLLPPVAPMVVSVNARVPFTFRLAFAPIVRGEAPAVRVFPVGTTSVTSAARTYLTIFIFSTII